MEAITWLILFLILIVLEAVTLGLTTIWFAGGALVGFIAAMLDVNYMVQIVLFLIVSIVLLVVTRPIAVEYLNKDRKKTNVEEIVGKTARVIKNIDNSEGTGEVILDGEVWMARSGDNEIIEEGRMVTVTQVEGVKLIVK